MASLDITTALSTSFHFLPRYLKSLPPILDFVIHLFLSLSLSLSHSSSASTTKSHTFWSPTLRQCRNLQTAVSPIVSSSYLPTSYITQKQIEIPTSPVYIFPFCLLFFEYKCRALGFNLDLVCRKNNHHLCRKVWVLFKNSPW